MKITKTTINYAEARNIELVVDDELVSFYDMNDDSEPMVMYTKTEDGELFFKGNIWLSKETKEELPNWVKSEKQLREMINFLSANK